MDRTISDYFSQMGQKGGRRSRRQLSREDARKMVMVREARKAFKRYSVQCFWSFDPNYIVTLNDVDWVSQQLKRYGDRTAYEIGVELCR